MLESVVSVKQFPYRTARVVNPFMSLCRSDFGEAERVLATKAGVSQDNHVVYEIVDGHGMTIYIFVSDLKVYFGSKIVLGNY